MGCYRVQTAKTRKSGVFRRFCEVDQEPPDGEGGAMPAMQIVSVKFDPAIVEAIKEEAQRVDLPYTHIIREATIAELERRKRQAAGETCNSISFQASVC